MTNQNVSSFISTQLPEFVTSDYPKFAAFLQAYYSYLDSQAANGTNYVTRNLLSYKDVDTTTDEFINHFTKEYIPDFETNTLLAKNKLIKLSKDFYNTKGSEDSLLYLFKVLFDEDVEVYYPKQDILKASDGKWQQPQYIKLKLSALNAGVNLDYLIKRKAVGLSSAASCTIENYQRSIDPVNQSDVLLLYVSNVSGIFRPNELIEIDYYDVDNVFHAFVEKITGAISNIVLDKGHSGARYNVGDPVIIRNGLDPTSTFARDANAYVSQVSTGEVIGADVVDGGFGFRNAPYGIANVISQPGDPGYGAVVEVVAVDTANGFTLNVNTDTIDTYATTTLNAIDYLFQENVAVTNINSTLISAFNDTAIQFSPLQQLRVTNTGGGYLKTPSINVETYFDTDLSIANSAYQQPIKAMGMIGGIKVINPGTGYNTSTDLIKLVNPYAGGCNISYTTNGTGSIMSVTVDPDNAGYRGYGYYVSPPIIIQKSDGSDSQGTGAVLQAFLMSSGDIENVTVDGIGKIQGFQITDLGFDYILQPNVSLRIIDVYLTDNISHAFNKGQLVYQGSANLPSFVATVGTYDTANGFLRLYDYQGALNVSSNLYSNTDTAGVSSYIFYGDGNATANAVFKGGVIADKGFYLNDDGFLSAGKVLQDTPKYHNFSYVVRAKRSLREFKDIILKIIHPAGMSLLSDYDVSNEIIDGTKKSNTIIYLNEIYPESNVHINSFDPNGNVVGDNTAWSNANVGSLMVITQNSRIFVSTIRNVINSHFLQLESNLKFFGTGTVNVSQGSNVVVWTSNTFEEIWENDILEVRVPLPYSNITANLFGYVTVNTYPYSPPPVSTIVYVDNAAFGNGKFTITSNSLSHNTFTYSTGTLHIGPSSIAYSTTNVAAKYFMNVLNIVENDLYTNTFTTVTANNLFYNIYPSPNTAVHVPPGNYSIQNPQ